VFEAFTANKIPFWQSAASVLSQKAIASKTWDIFVNQQVMITSCTDLDDQCRAHLCNIGF